ncbi:MAG: glycosyltransferase [Sulfurospirillaceae bacterium]|nr:glycosyltransferase [Sulfurospirillaceae bacterium]
MKITTIIPTFNRASHITTAIESVINQSYKVDEIIIVDDGSTDNTQEILERFQDLKVIKTKNRGVSSARNIGIKEATNEWICFLDSDDEWLSEKIKSQILLHNEREDILFSHTSEIWQKDGKIVKYPKRLAKPEGHCFLENLSTCKIAASSVMVHKSVFDDIGCFDEDMRVCEDYDMWLRISHKYELGHVKEAMIIKKAGHAQLSNSIFAIDRYHISSLQKFLDTPYHDGIKNEIIKKCNILIKGALKHKNTEIYETYSKMIRDIQS